MELPTHIFFKQTDNREIPMRLKELDLKRVKHNLLSDFKNEITVDSKEGQVEVQTPIESKGERISVFIHETQSSLIVTDTPSGVEADAIERGEDIANEFDISYKKGFYTELPAISSYDRLTTSIWKVAQASARGRS